MAQPAQSLPLMHSQLGMRDGQQNAPESAAYKTGFVSWYGPVDGMPPDVDLLVASVQQTLAEAPGLTARVHVDADRAWSQTVQRSEGFPVGVIDLSGEPDPRSSFRGWIAERRGEPLGMTGEPLVRVDVIVLHEFTIALAGWGHHIVVDGFGAGLYRARLLQHYVSSLRQSTPPQAWFGDFTELVRAERCSTPADLEHWVSLMADPPRRMSFAGTPGSAATRSRRTTTTVARQTIHPDHGRLDNGSFTVLAIVAAWVALLLDETEAVLGVPLHNRRTPLERITPSMMMTELPMRVPVDANDTISTLAGRCRAALASSRNHSAVRPEQLFDALPSAWRTGRVHGPTVNVIAQETVDVFDGVRSSWEITDFGPVRDMSVVVMTGGADAMTIELLTNPDLYTRDDHRRHSDRLTAWVRRCLSSSPDTPLAALDVLTDDELHAHAELMSRHANAPGHGRTLERDGIVTPAMLGRAAGITETVDGVRVHDSRGRPTIFDATGCVTVLLPGNRTIATDLLASVGPDGVRYRGLRSEHRYVRKTLIDLGAVAETIGRHSAVTTSVVDATRPVILTTLSPGSDVHRLRSELAALLPRGVSLDVISANSL